MGTSDGDGQRWNNDTLEEVGGVFQRRNTMAKHVQHFQCEQKLTKNLNVERAAISFVAFVVNAAIKESKLASSSAKWRFPSAWMRDSWEKISQNA